MLNNFAWVLATSPDDDVRDGKRAVELATKAGELTERERAHILSTLAAAYAETGDFDAARKWSQKSVDMQRPRARGPVGEGAGQLQGEQAVARAADGGGGEAGRRRGREASGGSRRRRRQPRRPNGRDAAERRPRTRMARLGDPSHAMLGSECNCPRRVRRAPAPRVDAAALGGRLPNLRRVRAILAGRGRNLRWARGGIGRRARLRALCPQGRAGSTPVGPT